MNIADDLDEFTMSFRVTTETLGGSRYIIDQSVGSTGFALRMDPALDQFHFFYYSGGGGVGGNHPTVLVTNTWYHVIIRASAAASDIWVDGSKTSVGVGTVDTAVDTANLIGDYAQGGNDWLGGLDHAFVWDHAKTDREVLDLFVDPYAMFKGPEFVDYVPALAAGPGGITPALYYQLMAGAV